MKSLLCLFVLTIVVNSSGVNSLKSYRNYKVVSLEIDNETQLKEIQNLELQVGVRIRKNRVDTHTWLFQYLLH